MVLFPHAVLDATEKQAVVELRTLLINEMKKIKKA
jgi:hypothetical protein